MQSPFNHLIHTNYAPSAAESKEITDFCSGPAAELERSKTEIAKLQEALVALTSQRDEIQQALDSHRALLAPVRQMPTGMLQRIFVFCRHPRRNPVMHHSEAPLLLGRICSRWRSVSLGMPELWDSIHAVSERLSKDGKRTISNADGVVAWLQRSGDIPLNISLYTESPTEKCHSDTHEHFPILPTFIPYARRWKYIELEVSQSELTALRVLESKDVPLLETFVFRERGEGWGRLDDIDKIAFLATAPSLTRFSVHNFRRRIDCLQLPWDQLRDLYLDTPLHLWGASSFLRIFADCSRLQRCTFGYSRVQGDNISVRPITLPRLHVLCRLREGERSQGSHARRCLDSLILPNLRTLEIEAGRSCNDGGVTQIDAHMITSLLLRSSCSLRKLDLGRAVTVFQSEALIECLQLTPELQEFVFSSYTHTGMDDWPYRTESEAVMDALTLVPASSCSSSERLRVADSSVSGTTQSIHIRAKTKVSHHFAHVSKVENEF